MFYSAKLRPAALGAFALLLLSGCGGGGEERTTARPLTRAAVIEMLRTGVERSAELAGAATRSKRTTDRKVAGVRSSRLKATREHEEEGGFYEDEWLGLWIESVSPTDENPTGPSGDRYWVDHEKTQPAGHSFRWASETGTYPLRLKSETTILAGRFEGTYDLREDVLNEDESGSATGRGTIPGEVSWTFTGSWTLEGRRTFTERAEFAGGTWQTYTVKDDADLSNDLTIVSSLGVTYRLHTAEDGSGAGRIEGDDDLLPATIVWNADGLGTITWRDGTTSEFNLYGE